MKRLFAVLGAVTLVAAACSTSGSTETTTSAPESPAMGPAEVVFEAQGSDGATITVASVTLPSAGFIAVHANNDGTPGPVIGHSALIPAGTTTGVAITLDTPLGGTDLLFPMAHIDVDGDDEYLFAPPDDAVDLPAVDADGKVAVVGAEVTIES